jgi:ABC-type multidrug transport system ATPase subunit
VNIEEANYKLTDLSKVNIILGRNGCGKSTLLKAIEQHVAVPGGDWGIARYITPERGGSLVYDANVEQSVTTNAQQMAQTRRANQFPQFRQQTMLQYRRLELSILRQVDRANSLGTISDVHFETHLQRINSLLENIEIRQDDQSTTFKIYLQGTDEEVPPAGISSGESELISLAIECLTFSLDMITDKENLLCLDEPDVHLHPDLQARLMKFLDGLVVEFGFTILMATHSTPILGELSSSERAAVTFMTSGAKELTFRPIDEIYRKILPVFGAHPLSNVFNNAPVLLVEGEDDVRVWQQAVRSSDGQLKVYPVECGSINELASCEQRTHEILDSVYDHARAFSLRDGDGVAQELDDLPPVTRMRLSCRAAENLMLSNEVLDSIGKTWEEVKVSMDNWIANNPEHSRNALMQSFKDSGYLRKDFDLKNLRMLIVGTILESNKPWEVLVGQTLGMLESVQKDPTVDGSICNYLGAKATANLLV